MKYKNLKAAFQRLKKNYPQDNLTAHIIFTEDSFPQKYTLLKRTYRVSSNNKAFYPHTGGYSIFGSCLDGSDQSVWLDCYMAEEGNPGGWKVQNCYILEQMRDAAVVPCFTRTEQKDGTDCYTFGNTRIYVRESVENGRIRLEPLDGNQIDYGDWLDLTTDQLYGYCTLLERCLNQNEII